MNIVRKYWPVILLGLAAIILIVGSLSKNKLNDYISEKMRESNSGDVRITGEMWVDSLFNYNKNSMGFQFTLLEFKSNGCNICKRMEPELEKINNIFDAEVNVVVLNIMNQNSLNVMKFFGISAVPTQLLLDKSGKELFRNYGFISANELTNQINKRQ